MQSSSGVEFFALDLCIHDVKWCRNVLHELEIYDTGITEIFMDNIGSISWVAKVQGLPRIQHTGIKYYFVRKPIEKGTVTMLYNPSNENRINSLRH